MKDRVRINTIEFITLPAPEGSGVFAACPLMLTIYHEDKSHSNVQIDVYQLDDLMEAIHIMKGIEDE